MAPAKWKEFFFIVAFAQQQGAEILQKRIQEQINRYESLPKAGLEAAISYQILEIPPTKEDHPGEYFVRDLTRSIGDQIRKSFQEEDLNNGQENSSGR